MVYERAWKLFGGETYKYSALLETLENIVKESKGNKEDLYKPALEEVYTALERINKYKWINKKILEKIVMLGDLAKKVGADIAYVYNSIGNLVEENIISERRKLHKVLNALIEVYGHGGEGKGYTKPTPKKTPAKPEEKPEKKPAIKKEEEEEEEEGISLIKYAKKLGLKPSNMYVLTNLADKARREGLKVKEVLDALVELSELNYLKKAKTVAPIENVGNTLINLGKKSLRKGIKPKETYEYLIENKDMLEEVYDFLGGMEKLVDIYFKEKEKKYK